MYSTKQFFYCFCVSLLFGVNSFSQQIPPSRITDWTNPGCQNDFVPLQLVNMVDFNPDTSGSTACDLAFQSALASVAGPKKILFPEGKYLFNQTLVLPDSIILEGEADDNTLKSKVLFLFSPGIDKHGILVQGSEQNLGLTVNGNLPQGSYKIYVPNSGLQTGDYIRLHAMDDSTYITSYAWASNSTGQICKIVGVDADSLLLDKPLRRTYSQAPVIFKINPRNQVHIKCINFERVNQTVYQTSNVFFDLAADCSVSGAESYNTNFGHITIQKSSRVTITNSYFHDAFDYGDGGVGYGVVLQSTASDCYVYSNRFNHLRHSILLQSGSNGNVVAYNYSTNPYWVSGVLPANSAGDIVLHGNYPYMNLFEGNVIQNIVIDNSHGINGPFNTFFRNRAELYGIFMNNSPATSQQNFIGNQVTNNGFLLGLYSLQGSDHYQYGNTIRGTLPPSGTGEYIGSSLFGYDFPEFYSYYSSVPPINLDNWQTTNPLTETVYRSLNGKNSVCSNVEYENPFLMMDDEETSDIVVFPNPSNGIFYVEGNGILFIEIFDLNGKKCQANINSSKVDLSNYSNGIYLLKIYTENSIEFKKVLVDRF